MIIDIEAHWGGDAERFAASVTLTANGMREAKELALLGRLLRDAETRSRLLELADGVECEMEVLGARHREQSNSVHR